MSPFVVTVYENRRIGTRSTTSGSETSQQNLRDNTSDASAGNQSRTGVIGGVVNSNRVQRSSARYLRQSSSLNATAIPFVPSTSRGNGDGARVGSTAGASNSRRAHPPQNSGNSIAARRRLNVGANAVIPRYFRGPTESKPS